MGLSESKHQRFLGESSNGLIDDQVDKEEIELSADHHNDKNTTTTGTRERRRTRFTYSIDTESSVTPSTCIPVTTECESCALYDEQELYNWELVDSNVLRTALNFREELISWDNNTRKLKKKIFSINKGYLTLRLDDLKNPPLTHNIRSLFKRAIEECNPKFIIEAYTTEQVFSKLLNKDMARIVLHDIKKGCSKFSCDTLYRTQDGTKSIASILLYYPEFTTFQGKVYRGMYLPSELEHFQVNCCIMTNTFLSTSKKSSMADMFSGYNRENEKFDEDKEGWASIYCTYIIKNINGIRRALDISEISRHPHEEEVLLLPYSVFLITKRETIELANQKGKRIEIELDECDEAQLSASLNQ